MNDLFIKVRVSVNAWLGGFHRRIDENFSRSLGLIITLSLSCYLAIYHFFAAPRGFAGDFYAVMFDPAWWDGTGVFYGPIVVFERWLVNAFPTLFTIEFFGFFTIVLIGLSIFICIKVTHPDRTLTLIYVAMLGMNTYFFYSFSVAANPELIELVFLLMMWWGLSTKHFRFSWFILTCAILTKLVPIIFVPLLIAFFSWTALLTAVMTGFVILVIVSLGQKQSIFLSISQIVDTKSTVPQPTSEQFLGLSSALARFFGLEPGSDFTLVNNVALYCSLMIYLVILVLTVLVYKSKKEPLLQIKVSYLFIVYLSIIPVLHLNAAHRHTFLFLAPVFVGLGYILKSDRDASRSKKFRKILVVGFVMYSFLPIYILDFYNFDNFLGVNFGENLIKSLLYLTEPIWLNIALITTLILYGKSRFLVPNSFVNLEI